IAMRRTEIEQAEQLRRGLAVRTHLDVGAAGIYEITIEVKLVLDPDRCFYAHCCSPLLEGFITNYRQARASRTASPTSPVRDLAAMKERNVVFSFSRFGVPSTRRKFVMALET